MGVRRWLPWPAAPQDKRKCGRRAPTDAARALAPRSPPHLPPAPRDAAALPALRGTPLTRSAGDLPLIFELFSSTALSYVPRLPLSVRSVSFMAAVSCARRERFERGIIFIALRPELKPVEKSLDAV